MRRDLRQLATHHSRKLVISLALICATNSIGDIDILSYYYYRSAPVPLRGCACITPALHFIILCVNYYPSVPPAQRKANYVVEILSIEPAVGKPYKLFLLSTVSSDFAEGVFLPAEITISLFADGRALQAKERFRYSRISFAPVYNQHYLVGYWLQDFN